MALKPLIGIIAKSDLVADPQELPRFSVLKQYVKALNRFGAAVTLIPPQDAQGLKICFGMIDGLLLAGGSDLNVDASGYLCLDETNGVDIERDRAEVEMARMALEKDTPVLGICRGMQLLNVVSGGSLCQDISSLIPNALTHTSDWRSQKRDLHSIKIVQGTMLSSLAEHAAAEVNGNHHQCVQVLADRMIRSAIAPDGVIEAIESPSNTYVLGIQWHPEWLIEDNEQLSLNIFSSFVAAAERRRGRGATRN